MMSLFKLHHDETGYTPEVNKLADSCQFQLVEREGLVPYLFPFVYLLYICRP